ncbi:ACT domain-containing protein [Salinisphaera sp. SPP-AMP-43]|uniref:ACT domain-containing protein n=1 Tax=Salinisphaera sp. SPP-AMP-43 TaxID=3121288 RepID=UPI003C6E310B
MQDWQTYRLICRLAPEPAGLERLFQVVRRRGFVIAQVAAEQGAEELYVDLTVSGTRSVETLRAHLAKIHTLRSVHRPLEQRFIVAPVSPAVPVAG